MIKPCDGIHRTEKGDRLMVALVTDNNTNEVQDTILTMRKTVPAYASLTDVEMRDELMKLIAKIPKQCPKCDGGKE